jgi:hypothetical protein
MAFFAEENALKLRKNALNVRIVASNVRIFGSENKKPALKQGRFLYA